MNTNPLAELHTLRDFLRYAISRFNAAQLSFGHGSDNAWDEAAYLLLHVLRLPLDTLEPFLDARLLANEKARCIDIIERRVNERLPAAYLTGEAWLQGHRFIVDERVIVPRSPISELLAEALEPWIAEPDAINHVLDLCTGSGCLAILAALAFPNSHVDAVDLSKDALKVADININQFGLEKRVKTYQSDLFERLPACRYQLILCNPPYVNSSSMQTLPPEYQHEPTLALAGGSDGMDIVRKLLRAAPDYMSEEGLLVLEIGNEYDHFCSAFPELEPVWLSSTHTDTHLLMLTREQLAP